MAVGRGTVGGRRGIRAARLRFGYPSGLTAVLGGNDDRAADGVRAVVRRSIQTVENLDAVEGRGREGLQALDVEHLDAVHEDEWRVVQDKAGGAATLELGRPAVATLPVGELRRLLLQDLPRGLAAGAGDHLFGDDNAIAVVADGAGRRVRVEAGRTQPHRWHDARPGRAWQTHSDLRRGHVAAPRALPSAG